MRNQHFQAFLADCDALHHLVGPDESSCRFVDVVDGRAWTLRPNAGPVPWWIMVPGRSAPRRSVGDLLALARLATASRESTVAACVPDSSSYRSLWEPITVACMNAPPARASAQLLCEFIRDAFRHGAALYRQRLARGGLSECFVEPALATLRAHGGTVHLRRCVHRLEFAGDRVIALHLNDHAVALAPADAAVLALPPAASARLVPGLDTPHASSAIVTVHFTLDPPAPPQPELTCVIEERSLWLLARERVATATIGAADDLLQETPAAIARRLWAAAAVALGRDPRRLPRFRVLKFRNGTFAHTPSDLARRPDCRTRWTNLLLAGDWTATGVPATVDGAALSGHRAAAAALAVS